MFFHVNIQVFSSRVNILIISDNVKIKVLPPAGESVDDIIQGAAKKQLARLKEKYKDFKGEK